MRSILTAIILMTAFPTFAQRVSGTVYNEEGDVLPFASITIKGTSAGTSANNKGNYSITLKSGKYNLVCQHIGYTSVDTIIELKSDREISFILSERKLVLDEVIIKSGGEDPAYAIIREAIKKRPFYNNQVKSLETSLYTKDLIKLRKLPKKIFGQKIQSDDVSEMGLDSAGKGILYLSESISTIYSQDPDKLKIKVHSSRVSGSSGFGFSFPSFISLYNNNVKVFTERFNPRGFVSPIADGAISFYKYKFLGTFFEDGKMINAIRVTPRRLYEPLFSGTINITDDDWRIHSFELQLTKTSQLEILDTLRIQQLHVPVTNDTWRVKNQLLFFNFKMLGIDAIGNFLNVFSDYKLNPVFEKKFFDRVFMQYDTGVDKRTRNYWDSIRPVPLEIEEQLDYKVKDSLFQQRKDSMHSQRYIDSLNRSRAKLKPLGLFWGGWERTKFKKKSYVSWSVDPLIKNFEYNTAEGVVTTLHGSISGPLGKNRYIFKPVFRYGFNNGHLNPSASFQINNKLRNGRTNEFTFAGGKRVSDFNKEGTLSPLINSISTLVYGKNYLKTYENYFGSATYSTKYESGVRLKVNALFEDRLPLNNTTDFTIFKEDSIHITPNYPYEKIAEQFQRHQAFIVSVSLSIQPGQRYIKFPYSKVAIGSKYPTFGFEYSKGIKGILGSDVHFDKWRITVKDGKNFKLAGHLDYKFGIGGFIQKKNVFIQDYQHFNGNRSLMASEYVNSFQLAPFYANSTTASFYALGHVEHHFNGLFTNKIPLFRRLNWNLVAGSNAFYVNNDNNYIEVFGGIENIFKIFRVDFVAAYQNGAQGLTGIRIGAGGIIGGGIKRDKESNTATISF